MINSNNKRILVADDEPDITLMLKRVLEENGFRVDSFNEPSAVLQSFKPGIYDLLILDIKMPSINGFELYLKLREIDPNVKVCFLTALSELRDYEDYKKEVFPKWGERYFVSKPIENEELIRRLNAMIWSYWRPYNSHLSQMIVPNTVIDIWACRLNYDAFVPSAA